MAKEYTPFKMKGSPMQRNFGIGAEVKAKTGGKEQEKQYRLPDGSIVGKTEYLAYQRENSPLSKNLDSSRSPLEQRPAATITGFPVKTKKERDADKLERARKRRKRRQWLYKKTGWKVFDY